MVTKIKFAFWKDNMMDDSWQDLAYFDPQPVPVMRNKRLGKIGECPAFLDSSVNYWEIRSPIDFEIRWDEDHIQCSHPEVIHDRNFEIGPGEPRLLSLKFQYLFMADTDVIAELYPPFFDTTAKPFYLIPARFNCGSWTRPMEPTWEFTEKTGVWNVKRGDPLMYVRFTSANIYDRFKLEKVELTQDLYREVIACSTLKFKCPALGLRKMYQMYKESIFNIKRRFKK